MKSFKTSAYLALWLKVVWTVVNDLDTEIFQCFSTAPLISPLIEEQVFAHAHDRVFLVPIFYLVLFIFCIH